MSDLLHGDDNFTTTIFRSEFFQEKAGCVGWTWTSENHSEFPNYCFMFSALDQPKDFPDSIRKRRLYLIRHLNMFNNFLTFSGPPTCLCSKVEACEVNGDNRVNVLPDITKVLRSDMRNM